MMYQDSAGSYLNVGDVVLYGKFKNALARIVSFGVSDKGDPTIDVQPINKDGTEKPGSPKTLTLLKVRKVEKQARASGLRPYNLRVAMTAMSHRIVARYLDRVAGDLGLGKTWENGKVRIHRYADFYKVWDLANAGKRGKKVRVMDISPNVRHKSEWLENQSKFMLFQAQNYDSIKRFYTDILHDFPGEIIIEEHWERGIDVLPGDTKEIKVQWKVGDELLDLKASPLEFLLSSSVPLRGTKGGPGSRMDTLYWHVKRTDAAIFYGWLVENEARLKTMGAQALKDLWHDMGVRYDSH